MPTILVVDDNPGDRHLAGLELKKIQDVTLLNATNGVDALEVMSGEVPDVVLTDMMMPKMDGLELVRQITKQYPKVPVVLMTSCGSEQIAIEALNAGAASYVSKAKLAKILQETTEHVLEVARADRQRSRLLKHLQSREMQFVLENEPAMIPPMVGYFVDHLEKHAQWGEVDRTRIGIALKEALDNALYHGNLELDSALRENDTAEYYRLADLRREQAPYAGRRIFVTATESPDRVSYVIRDEGPGFNPSEVPDPTEPENMDRVSGRGLLLINTFMDTVEHNDLGNQIELVKVSGRQVEAQAAIS